ncbi:DNA repair protein Rhp41 [Amniculicola lignicola CBS 123094]|uniref:DNA repair protein Rhp41 n=1 Tax=Amniculicola lignicola CBS 123094 TaxID=1392246 RepID=A0A6A5WNZ8_9PLEO|nr:DNA repair protein Rhp41 [Amniculicola lignicola CBS 123094]
MAGTRGRLRKPPRAVANATPRRSSRRGRAAFEDEEVPDVFQDLLAQAQASRSAGADEDSKPLKKRKTTLSSRQRNASHLEETARKRPTIPETRSRLQTPAQPVSALESHDHEPSDRVLQTITDSEESDDSDMEWEDALADGNTGDEDNGAHAMPEVGDLSITIGGDAGPELAGKKRVRRRGITSVDRKLRLDVHKAHILCLLCHVHRRNIWCNDGQVQAVLRRLPSPRTLSELVPNPQNSQYQASKRFLDGMNTLKTLWSRRFSVTAMGMHKPRWDDADADVRAFSDFDDLDDPMDKEDFRTAARTLEGSQDIGAQLFCALLRGIGIEARLVCSLQCLPFASAGQASTPQKSGPEKNKIYLDPYNKGDDSSLSKPKNSTPSRPKRWSRLERAVGMQHPAMGPSPVPKQTKKYQTVYPVYWVEAYNTAFQKWTPIDPLSTSTVNEPDKLEPPLNSTQNSLVYAIAFEEDLSAKDVTRRYAKAYNAKTRKFRVESTGGGATWWRRALRSFKRITPMDRDQVEDSALARKEAAEGMPKNVQDFKNHPVYVLERHLRHNEVIHPMQTIGKLNVGTAMNPKMEPIYRRKDVHIVRSADKWYRLGRDLKDGEHPLKHAKPKKGARRSLSPTMDLDDDEEPLGAGLYALFQTNLYVPPPVAYGRVPRNAYGNLDVYVPSMIPAGGVHIPHKQAAKAARIVGVDSADAVTGFSFKGRHGTAIIQGVIVASEYKDAVEAVLDAMEYAQEEAENNLRSSEALRLWRRFLIGLRIAQRVNAIEIDGEVGPVYDVSAEIEKEDHAITEQQMAGGFFLDERGATEPEFYSRRQIRRVIEEDDEDDDMGGGFIPKGNSGFVPDVYEGSGGFIPEDESAGPSNSIGNSERPPRSHQEDEFSGGFVREDEDEDEAGGFIREQSPSIPRTIQEDADVQGGFFPKHTMRDDHGRGFIVEDEPAIHDTLQPMAENTDNTIPTEPEKSTKEVPTKPSDTEENATEDGVSDLKREEETVRDFLEEATPPPSSASMSETSLPLEDPDDEDADPDWLVDVT